LSAPERPSESPPVVAGSTDTADFLIVLPLLVRVLRRVLQMRGLQLVLSHLVLKLREVLLVLVQLPFVQVPFVPDVLLLLLLKLVSVRRRRLALLVLLLKLELVLLLLLLLLLQLVLRRLHLLRRRRLLHLLDRLRLARSHLLTVGLAHRRAVDTPNEPVVQRHVLRPQQVRHLGVQLDLRHLLLQECGEEIPVHLAVGPRKLWGASGGGGGRRRERRGNESCWGRRGDRWDGWEDGKIACGDPWWVGKAQRRDTNAGLHPFSCGGKYNFYFYFYFAWVEVRKHDRAGPRGGGRSRGDWTTRRQATGCRNRTSSPTFSLCFWHPRHP